MNIKVNSPSFATNLLAFFAVCYTLYFAQTLLLPVVLAFLLFFLFRPIVRQLKRVRIPTALSAGLIVVTLVTCLGATLGRLIPQAAIWIDQAPTSIVAIEKKLHFLKEPFQKLSRASATVTDIGSVGADKKTMQVEIKSPALSAMVFDATGNLALGIFITVIMLYFLLAGGDTLLLRIARFLPDSPQKTMQLMDRIEQNVSRYLLTFTVINACLGIAIGSAMWAVGLPNPVLWGVMAALLNYVPYVGATLGAAVVFLVGLLSLNSLWQAAAAPACYFLINTIEGYIITPSLMGRWLSLSPLMILFFITFWGWIWGAGGALLAVPLLAVLKLISDNSEGLRPLSRILGE